MNIFSPIPAWIAMALLLCVRVTAQNGDPNLPPLPFKLSIDAPADGEMFASGAPITLRATAIDPAGAVLRLEFLADNQRIGVSEILTLVPVTPGEPVHHEWVWKGAPPGRHALTVRAQSRQEFPVTSSPVNIVVGSEGGSSIRMESPTDGSVFSTPGTVPMTVVTLDPLSEIRRVEFWTDDQRLGVAEILTRDVIIPGRPRTLSFTWTNPPPGIHALWALGKDSSGTEIRSKPSRITVKDSNGGGVPEISVVAAQSPIWEVGELKDRMGSFELRRKGGDLTQALAVFFKLGGEATLGTDYRILQPVDLALNAAGTVSPFGSVMFLPGALSVSLGIEALADKVLEGTESVVLTVVESPLMMPMIWPVPAGDYRVGIPSEAVIDINEGGSAQNSLVIVSPEDGARFKSGPIRIETVGVGKTTPVTTVEFFANGDKIGEDCFVCRVDGIFPPGAPVHNGIDWVPAKEGRYLLTAVGHFGNGESITSQKVLVDVGTPPAVPTLSITQPASGSVVSPKEPVKVVAVGVGRVGGITDVELLLDGERVAESHLTFIRAPGVDEPVEHAFEVRIPLGEHVLRVRDLSDLQVVSAGVKVRSSLVQVGGIIRWMSPASGSRFAAGRIIPLVVEAMDPDGLIWEVGFYSGDQKIGTSTWDCPVCRLAPGATLTHRFEWKDAPIGNHVLHAEATRPDGSQLFSEKIEIEVVKPPVLQLSAVRDLPDSFEPGKPFTVRIAVTPAADVQNYVVEDAPPFVGITGAQPTEEIPHWVVTSVGPGGVADPVNGVVKFGPFFDAEPRTLSYEITPNAAAVEIARFSGRAVADGIPYPTGGDQVLMGTQRHPADIAPADDSLSATELTAYGAAWKSGKIWTVGPVPIPVDYVTRAAQLWRSGEHYRTDPELGPPPLCWVSDPLLPPTPGSESSAADASGQPLFRGIALRTSDPSVDGTRVAIRVMPAPGTQAFAVEEGSQGSPTEISDGGTWDSAKGVIRWGPFLDSNPRELRYRLAGVFKGNPGTSLASFDGASVRVMDAGHPDPSSPRLICVETARGGGMQVVMEDASISTGAEFELQVSTDLRNWRRAGGFIASETAGFARDDSASGAGPVFYRAVRIR